MRNKGFTLLALALALMLSCAPALALTQTAPGTLPLADETVHFTVGITQSGVVENWDTNAMTVKLENDLNVELEFVELGSTSDEVIQKVELMIMTGGDDLPDIIFSGLGGLANIVKYGQMGMLLPTTEYYKTLAAFTDESCLHTSLTKDQLLSYVTCYDGNIYGMIQYMESINNSYSGGRVMVYEPWLEKLNIEMPQTTEEFREMLIAFRDNDPNGNGQQDEIPMMGSSNTVMTNLLRALMNAFLPTLDNYFINNDGEVLYAPLQEQWREGLRYIKSLFDEGLISPLSLTQDNAQLTAVMNSSADNLVGAVARISVTNLGAQDIRRSQYICLDPLEGPEGFRNAYYSPRLPSINMVITKNCKNPEIAFRLGDYMCSELMSVWNRFGEENVDWEAPSEGAIGAYQSLGYPAKIKVLSTWGVLQNQWWAQVGPYILSSAWQDGQAAENIDYNAAVAIGRSMEKTLEYGYKNPIVGLVFNEDEQEVVTELRSTIESYISESTVQFLTGARDLDADWDAYIAEFEKMGLETYLEAIQSCVDRMNG